MKKGINIWSFPAGTDVRKAIQTAKKAGFQGIELAMDIDGLTGLPGADAAAALSALKCPLLCHAYQEGHDSHHK